MTADAPISYRRIYADHGPGLEHAIPPGAAERVAGNVIRSLNDPTGYLLAPFTAEFRFADGRIVHAKPKRTR